MSKTAKLIIAGIALIVLLPCFSVSYYSSVLHYSRNDALCSVLLGWATDTEWAQGYRERNFAKVTIGMTQAEVQRIMGAPVWIPNTNYWGYSWSPSSTHYHQRGFVFSPSGSVTQIYKGFYFD